MSAPAIRDYGDRALLLDCGSTDEVLALTAILRAADLAEVTDIVPGARTVLVTLTEPAQQAAMRTRLATVELTTPTEWAQPGRDDAVIDVIYDGADLAEVAALLKMDVTDVIEAHTGTPWRVGFGGFAPGFAYLVDGDSRLSVPRRTQPRTRVPAGSVALAGEFSGIYPRESPGGWQLIGHTRAVLWDVERTQPALLMPGMWVTFRAVDAPMIGPP